MQTRNPLFDDMARLANGAMSAVAGMKEEMEALVRQRLEALLADMDLVSREEFEAVQAMAAKARAEQERLAKRVADLEAALAEAKPAPRRAARKADDGAD